MVVGVLRVCGGPSCRPRGTSSATALTSATPDPLSGAWPSTGASGEHGVLIFKLREQEARLGADNNMLRQQVGGQGRMNGYGAAGGG